MVGEYVLISKCTIIKKNIRSDKSLSECKKRLQFSSMSIVLQLFRDKKMVNKITVFIFDDKF